MTDPRPTQSPDDVAMVDEAPKLLQRVAHLGPIEDSDTYTKLAAALIEVKRIGLALEQRREEIMEPVKALRKTATEWFGEAQRHYQDAETHLKVRLCDYVQRRTTEAGDEARAALAAGNTTEALQAMTAFPQVPGLSYRSEIHFVVHDIDLVPEEYVTRTYRKREILAALKRGESIPGVERLDSVTLAVTVPKD